MMHKLKTLLKLHFPYLLILIGVLLLLTRNLWGTRAWIETHDGIFHLIRLEVMIDMLKAGAFPVRWVSSLDNGFGLPLFTYMYPGPYYLGSPLALLGLSSKWVIKLVTIFLYGLGMFGIYGLLESKNKILATLSAILYATTPYLLLNIFVRGALGEFMAISLVPWALLSLQDLAVKKKVSWYHPLPYALMLLSHNFLSFLFLPVMLILAYFLYKPNWRALLSSLVISLSLASFFVLPMILGRGDLASFNQQNFTYLYYDHFVYLSQLISSPWGYGHSYAGLNDGFSFALGIPALIILVLGLYFSFIKKNLAIRTWTILTVITIFLLSPASAFIWQIITPLQIMQFPWRLLSFMPIGIPLLYFAVFTLAKPKKSTYILSGILVFLSLIPAYLHTIPPYYQSNDQLAQQLYIHRDQTTTSSRLELLPKWVSPEVRYRGDENLRITHGNATVDDLVISPTKISFKSKVESDEAVYRLRRNYYPGWQVRDQAGKKYSVTPTSDGEVSWTVKKGSYNFVIKPGVTLVEKIGNLISLLSIVGLCFYAILPSNRRKSV